MAYRWKKFDISKITNNNIMENMNVLETKRSILNLCTHLLYYFLFAFSLWTRATKILRKLAVFRYFLFAGNTTDRQRRK